MNEIISALEAAQQFAVDVGADELLATIDAALAAAREQQPVAWTTTHPPVCVPFTENAEIANSWRENGWPVRSLYATPPADAEDAARYRWLRANHNADLLAEDVIDEAIDAARGGEHGNT